MSRFSRIGIILAVLALIAAVSFAIPTFAYASAPAQTGSGDPQQDSVNALLSLVIALVAGGVFAYVLNDIPFWKNWTPNTTWLKPLLVVFLTAVVGAGLASLQVNVLPQYFGALPAELRTALAWAAVYLSSQITHQYDAKTEAERALARFQLLQSQSPK